MPRNCSRLSTAGLAIRNGTTHKIDVTRDREGYDRSETTYEKISLRRITGVGILTYLLYFYFLES